MILQTAAAGRRRLAIMMYEHTALCQQLAHAFGNDTFEPLAPFDQMAYVIAHHDAGWAEFDRNPAIDLQTGLPYNLVETPPQLITQTSRKSPDFNERQHAFCGLISSMHSWGLYNGRYGLSDLVLIDKIPQSDRPLTDRMLEGELARQERLKSELRRDPATADWLDERRLMQNYKQLQFIDTLALYFNRIHPGGRGAQTFQNVPMSAAADTSVEIRPAGEGIYSLRPFPLAVEGAAFAFCGRPISPVERLPAGGWGAVLRQSPTEWEEFRLVAG